MQWVHSSLGKWMHAAPGAGAETSCDGDHQCLVCDSDSCPILSHNSILAVPPSASRLAHPS